MEFKFKKENYIVPKYTDNIQKFDWINEILTGYQIDKMGK